MRTSESELDGSAAAHPQANTTLQRSSRANICVSKFTLTLILIYLALKSHFHPSSAQLPNPSLIWGRFRILSRHEFVSDWVPLIVSRTADV